VDVDFGTSFDALNAMSIDASGDWWIASTCHGLSDLFFQVRVYHVNPMNGQVVPEDLQIQVDAVQALKLRTGGGSIGPVFALQYAGIQPANGQIVLFWRSGLTWTFADVDSNGAGSVDVAMTATNQQYVAYLKTNLTEPPTATMVCAASRTAPEVGNNRPFAVDTLIRIGHLGNAQPVKVGLFVDDQDRPVVLTLVAAADPGEVDRIYESVPLTATTDAPGTDISHRRLAVLKASPIPAHMNGAVLVDLSVPAERILVLDVTGRVLQSLPTGTTTHWELPARSVFGVPGIYFLVAEGTRYGPVTQRVVALE
jgi:hypothetical protein